MGMSAWMLFAAPYLAPAPLPQEPVMVTEQVEEDGDLFVGAVTLTEKMMRDAAGGTSVAVDITDLGVNVSDSRGLVRDIEINDTANGEIANNAVHDNSGITTVFNNTGNGVVFQSTVQVNIFLDGQQ